MGRLSLHSAAEWGVRFLLPIAICALPGNAAVGGGSGASLRAPAGAAGMALGGAQSADPAVLAAWYNPAALADISRPRAGLGMGIRSLGRTEGFADFAFRIPPRMAMGFSLLYRGDPFIRGLRDANEYELDNGAYTSLTLKTGLCYRLQRHFSLGASVGIFYQNMPTGYSSEDGSLDYSSATGVGGFDLAVRFRIRPRWQGAVVIRHLGARTQWDIESSSALNVQIEDYPLPEFVCAATFSDSLLNRPFTWHGEGSLFFVDGNFDRLARTEGVIKTGVTWHLWEKAGVRAGIGDLAFTRLMFSDAKHFWRTFSFRLAAGCDVDLSTLTPGLTASYAVSTDKIWAGIDQILDLVYTF